MLKIFMRTPTTTELRPDNGSSYLVSETDDALIIRQNVIIVASRFV